MYKNRILSFIPVFMLIAVSTQSAAQSERQLPVRNVAVVMDGPTERAVGLRALFLEEIRTVNRGEFDIRSPDDLQVEADWTLEGRNALEANTAPSNIYW